ncbi:MAG TPA: NAD(+)/NADH kinase [Firmicutes bacterium]|nr:NAD(+)/NADH kinase [Bacillota bacterium]
MTGFETKRVTKLGLCMHPKSPHAEDAVKRLHDAANGHGIKIIEINHFDSTQQAGSFDMIASIGGDGTLLAAARHAYPSHVPVWGINIGRLGFLTTSGTDFIETGVGKIASGDYMIEPRAMLEAEIEGGNNNQSKLVALNDIVLHRMAVAGMITLDAELNGRFLLTYEGDGLVISTPTGSTAYSMAAGGSILSPALRAFILTPICTHSLSARSLVVDDTSVLVMKPRFDNNDDVISVSADGQTMNELHPSTEPRAVIIRRAVWDAGLVRFEEVVFSDVLRDKLGWAGGASRR